MSIGSECGSEDISEIVRAPCKLESSDGKELDPKGKVEGYKIYYEDPDTGKKVVVKTVTKYDVLEAKYKAECEENTRLLRRVAQQKSENEVLHRKVKDLCHKLCQARRERDKLAEKLKNKSILDPVLAHKYWAQQMALKSDIGEIFECELNDGLPFEMGYYLRLSKKEYELALNDRVSIHVSFVKRSDKIAELNKEVADLQQKNADLQKKNRELSELIGEEVWGSKC